MGLSLPVERYDIGACRYLQLSVRFDHRKPSQSTLFRPFSNESQCYLTSYLHTILSQHISCGHDLAASSEKPTEPKTSTDETVGKLGPQFGSMTSPKPDNSLSLDHFALIGCVWYCNKCTVNTSGGFKRLAFSHVGVFAWCFGLDGEGLIFATWIVPSAVYMGYLWL